LTLMRRWTKTVKKEWGAMGGVGAEGKGGNKSPAKGRAYTPLATMT